MAEKPTLFVLTRRRRRPAAPSLSPCAGSASRRRHRLRQGDRRQRQSYPLPAKGSRDKLREATGTKKLPALKLADGTVITHSKPILSWIDQQKSFPKARAHC